MKSCFLFVLAIFFSINHSVFSQQITTWRGPNRNGNYDEVNLLKSWPNNGPDILWNFDGLGVGYGSPAFANNKIYIAGMEGTTGYIYALTEEGKLIWKKPYGEEFSTSYPGSRATPVIIGDYLYMLSGMGHLTCLNSISGKLNWEKNIIKEYGARNIMWGMNETLNVLNDMLIVTPGGSQHNLIALNRFYGQILWSSSAMEEKSAYCTPLLTKVGSRNLLVTHTEDHILGIDADDGKLLWSHGHTNIYSIHPNTPLLSGNKLFCFSGYGQGGVMLQLNEDGSKVTKQWFQKSLDSQKGGAVVLKDRIFLSGDKSREWQCVDVESGKILYETKDIGNGVVITAEGLLYLYSQRGELALVKAGSDSFEIISETKVSLGSGQHWAHPVIDKARLFIRHGDTLIAYKISN
jgi:outer membrane protein assembly factor BamB